MLPWPDLKLRLNLKLRLMYQASLTLPEARARGRVCQPASYLLRPATGRATVVTNGP